MRLLLENPPPTLRVAWLIFVGAVFLPLPPARLSAAEPVHLVQKGDTLWQLARRHQTTVAELQKANGLNGTVLRVGQKLIIPAKSPTVNNEARWRTARVTHTERSGEWLIETVQLAGDELASEGVRVRRGGQFVWASTPAIETAVDVYPGRGKPLAVQSQGKAADLTGRGTPLLFVRLFTDTKRFVADTEIFTLGNEFKRLARLEGVPEEGASFEDLDKDGVAEAIVGDTAFTGFYANRLEVHCPRVVLRLGPGGFQVARELMRTPLPSPDELKRRAGELRKRASTPQAGEETESPWEVLLPPVTALAYGGHLEAAKALFEQAAPWNGPERAKKWDEFKAALQQSQWWKQP